jgi:MFS family permease
MRIGAAPLLLVGAVATVGSSLVFLDIGVSSDYTVIFASRLLTGVGFGLAYATLNIQALTDVRDDEQGLASGLVGSSFQMGGAIVLAIATATILAHTPTHARPAASVHAFTAGVYVSVASASLLVLIAVAAWRGERRNAALPGADEHRPPARSTKIDADPLDVAA